MPQFIRTLLLTLLAGGISAGSMATETRFTSANELQSPQPSSFGETTFQHFISMYERGVAEKLYLQLDKPYYSSGENLWFKGYLVNAVTLVPMCQSQYIYVELIDRNNAVLQRVKIRANEHGFHNCLKLPPETAPGQYTLRAYTQWMRNSDEAFFFNRTITIGNPIDDAVKASIRYTPESDGQCTAEIVLTNSEYKPIADQRLMYQLSLDGKTKRYAAKTTQRGKLLVGFPIPKEDLPTNHLTVIIDDPNLSYEKRFFMPAFSKDYDVAFFPEGGHLLSDQLQTVAFKAIGTNGLSVEIKGQVVDEQGTPITSFETIHKGMGRLSFIPQAGKRYFAEISDSTGITKRFELPGITPSGCTLSVSELGGILRCQVIATPDIDLTKLGLVVHVKGQIIAAEPLAADQTLWTLDKRTLPPGIAHFAIVNQATGQPLSERLCFIHEHETPKVSFTTSLKQSGYREKVSLRLQLADTSGKPLEGSFAVSVTDGQTVRHTPFDGNIRSHLLLTSDLKGYIEEPGYYFHDRTPQTDHKLDLLMLTQGWTRFDLSDLLNGKLPAPEFLVEESQMVLGEVVGLFGKEAKSTSVTIGSLKDGYVETLPLTTSNKFIFPNCDFPDSTILILQSKRKKGGTTGLELRIEPETFPMGKTYMPMPHITDNPTDSTFIPLEYLDQLKEQYYTQGGIRVINLASVTVTAQRRHMFNGQYVEQVIGEEILSHFKGASQLGEALSYLRLSKSVERETGKLSVVTNKGEGINCFVVNDRKVDGGLFNMIPPSRVEAMGFLEPESAGKYGYEARNGAIVVRLKKDYTLTNVFNLPTLSKTIITPLGYKKPEAFYMPKYEIAKVKADPKPDLRTTLYWNPEVQNSCNLTFYTGDRSPVYDITLEGVTKDGQVCRYTQRVNLTD